MDNKNTENKKRGAFASVSETYIQEGLTKSEYEAIHICAAITSNQEFLKNINAEVGQVAIATVEMVNALFAELDKTNEQ